MDAADPMSDRPARDEAALLVVGELCVDLIVLLGDAAEVRFGQHEQLVPSTTLTMGSSSAITACGAARLGVPTSIVGVRGDDVFGGFVDAELRRLGVDTADVRVDSSQPTGSSTHLSRSDGDRAILTAMGSIGAVRGADAPDALLARFAHLHVGSYFLQESLWSGAPDLFRRARALGLTTSLDGNFDPAETWRSGVHEVLAHVETFFCNEQEATGITGIADERGAVDALLALMPAGAVVVFKRGADGAAVHDAHGLHLAARPPDATGALVDTVGAGDSLAAGYLAARLGGGSHAEALALGVACGTASTRGAGGTGAQADLTSARALAAAVEVAG